MMFDRVIGQERPKEMLCRAIEQDRLSHAYMFSGQDGVGKEALAIEFTKTLYCGAEGAVPCQNCSNCRRIGQLAHPDFQFIFPMPKMTTVEIQRTVLDSLADNPYTRSRPWASPAIGIDRIREVTHRCTLKPLEGHRVVVVAEADQMTAEAANALLKLLEEPPGAMHFILITSRLHAMLPTILSRCQEIRFGPISDRVIADELVGKKAIDRDQANIIARISQGSYRRALEWAEGGVQERRRGALELLRCCLKGELAQYEFVENNIKGTDKRLIVEMLSLLLIWFRDALVLFHLSQGERSVRDHIVNIDEIETLEKFVGAFDEIDFDQVFYEIERSIEMIAGNLQLSLIFLVLMARLTESLSIRHRR